MLRPHGPDTHAQTHAKTQASHAGGGWIRGREREGCGVAAGLTLVTQRKDQGSRARVRVDALTETHTHTRNKGGGRARRPSVATPCATNDADAPQASEGKHARQLAHSTTTRKSTSLRGARGSNRASVWSTSGGHAPNKPRPGTESLGVGRKSQGERQTSAGSRHPMPPQGWMHQAIMRATQRAKGGLGGNSIIRNPSPHAMHTPTSRNHPTTPSY